MLGSPLHELAESGDVARTICSVAPGQSSADRLRELPTGTGRFDLLEAFLLDRVAAARRPSPAVAWARARLAPAGPAADRGAGRTRSVGAGATYDARFQEQIGLSPHTAARLLRFDVCRRLDRRSSALGELAYDAGYGDRSHLNRDFRDLAGTTPH